MLGDAYSLVLLYSVGSLKDLFWDPSCLLYMLSQGQIPHRHNLDFHCVDDTQL